ENLSRAVTRGSGRVRSPSEWLSPFLTPFSVFLGYTPPSCGRAPLRGAPPLKPREGAAPRPRSLERLANFLLA
ncbi:MAG: hypothetical protein NC085_02195, partial [Muribaculaceae bacterium]|nr:hypothetical protein [Muribaculaceae bacterium]